MKGLAIILMLGCIIQMLWSGFLLRPELIFVGFILFLVNYYIYRNA